MFYEHKAQSIVFEKKNFKDYCLSWGSQVDSHVGSHAGVMIITPNEEGLTLSGDLHQHHCRLWTWHQEVCTKTTSKNSLVTMV